MTLSERDRRALIILAIALAVGGFIYWLSGSSTSTTGSAPAATGGTSSAFAAPPDSIDRAQRHIAALRKQAATVPGKEDILKQASAELGDREKGLLAGDTADQAQAQLVQVIKRVAKQQMPPLEMGQVELGRSRNYGSAYGQVAVSVSLNCRIEQLVNFLAGLGAQPELVSTEEIRFGASHPKQKNMPVRLTVSGLVARRLIPQQKGLPRL
jgi:hypothetical protein